MSQDFQEDPSTNNIWDRSLSWLMLSVLAVVSLIGTVLRLKLKFTKKRG